MQKAAKVGSKNSHTMRLMGRRISREFSAASSRRCFGSFMTPLSYLCFFRAAPELLPGPYRPTALCAAGEKIGAAISPPRSYCVTTERL